MAKAARVKVFITYRRDDTEGYADHLYEALKPRFGVGNIFIDIESLEPGEDFAAKIESTVAAADVVLVLIGPRWLTMTDPSGRRRLDAKDDWVRLEVEAALRRNDVVVIPVLLHGAVMPRAEDLPPSMAPLARRVAFAISRRVSDHADELADSIIRAAKRVRDEAERSKRPEPVLRRIEPTSGSAARVLKVGDAAAQPGAVAPVAPKLGGTGADVWKAFLERSEAEPPLIARPGKAAKPAASGELIDPAFQATLDRLRAKGQTDQLRASAKPDLPEEPSAAPRLGLPKLNLDLTGKPSVGHAYRGVVTKVTRSGMYVSVGSFGAGFVGFLPARQFSGSSSLSSAAKKLWTGKTVYVVVDTINESGITLSFAHSPSLPSSP